jgi:glycosyltransferase AglI
MGRPKRHISVIVPVHNREHHIDSCIRSLIDQHHSGRYDVVIVDNNSTDGTVDRVLRYDKVKLLFELRQGSYAARNTGARFCEGDIVVFTDSDCSVLPDFLARISSIFEDPSVQIIKGRVCVRPNETAFHSYQQREYDRRINNDSHLFETNCVAIRRSTLLDLGLFDERLLSGGDTDLSTRAKDSGIYVKYDPEIVVYHHPRPTLGSYFRMNACRGRGRVALLRKYGRSVAAEVMDIRPYADIAYQVLRAGVFSSFGKRHDALWSFYRAIQISGYRLGALQESLIRSQDRILGIRVFK